MGLFLSSIVSTTEKVMTLVPIALIPQIMLAGFVAKIQNPIVEVLSYATLSRWGTEGFGVAQPKVCSETISVEKVEGTGFVDSTVMPPKIVEAEFNIDTKDTIVSSVDNLQEMFHKSYERFGDLQGTLQLDTIMIGSLTLIFFLGMCIALKRKDPIKIR